MRAWELMSDIPPLQDRGEWEWHQAVRTESAAYAVRYHSPLPTQLRGFSDRQLPDPLAREREDRVAHGRRDRRRPGLAHAALRIAARHDVHLDVRHLGQPQHAIVVEVALLHPALVEDRKSV